MPVYARAFDLAEAWSASPPTCESKVRKPGFNNPTPQLCLCAYCFCDENCRVSLEIDLRSIAPSTISRPMVGICEGFGKHVILDYMLHLSSTVDRQTTLDGLLGSSRVGWGMERGLGMLLVGNLGIGGEVMEKVCP